MRTTARIYRPLVCEKMLECRTAAKEGQNRCKRRLEVFHLDNDLESLLRRRSNLSIIADILEAAKWGVFKNRIMNLANLNHIQLNSHLLFLLDREFLVASETSETKFRITEKGLKYLQYYREMMNLLV